MVASAPVSAPPGDLSGRRAALALGVLVLVGFGVRLWLMRESIAAGSFAPTDPDSYMRQGRELAQNGAGWKWTIEAIRYKYDGRTYLLPPLYPGFLSLFALFPGYPYSAAVGHLAINALSAVAVFAIGAAVHSRRAGLIAALTYAFWIPNIWTFALFMQEQLYLPLLLTAFAILLHATARRAPPWAFGAAGAAFGFAALTRSMPVYYLAPVAAAYFAMNRRDPAAARRTIALLTGFLAVTLPYSLWLSAQVDRFVFIENHGGISAHVYGGTRHSTVPTFFGTVLMIADPLFRDPVTFVSRWSDIVGALFHVHSDRWLHSIHASTAARAIAAKIFAHAAIDVPFIATVVLAPLGALLARRSREAVLLVLWIVVAVMLSALSGYGGVRYRAPIEPHFIVLASVVVARHWRRPARPMLIAGALTSVAAVGFFSLQMPRVAAGRANYGVTHWSITDVNYPTSAHGSLGVTVLVRGDVLRVRITPQSDVSMARPLRISLRIDGRPAAGRLIASPGPLELRYPWPRGLAYVEVTVTDPGGNPVAFSFEIPVDRPMKL